MPREAARTALTHVRVFDGQRITEPRTVVIDGDVISADTTTAGSRVVDGDGMVLIPGLIDAHVHLHGSDTLKQLCAWGVTTALDMATWPPQLLASLRHSQGLTDIRSAGTPAIGPGGPHARIPGMSADAIVRSPQQAGEFVAAQVSAGSDYIKIVAESPGDGGPDQETVNALVASARTHGKSTVVHAATVGAYTMALQAGADVVTHIPLDGPLDRADIERMAGGGQVCVPTLTMMEGTAAARGVAAAYRTARQNVSALHQAGVPVLAGTDANTQPGVPYQVSHGQSLHHELELLVDAGLTTTAALRAATTAPAHHFALHDRGAVTPGLRADLVLIDGDPLTDIRATRAISRTWCAGTEHAPA
ncbi:amidohydrolase family protein [Streptomyces sp. NBC_00006]|uniref:amidohydrolase family protein n=1 Tax=Streptomyces sp. NBC_00006 TaxID=2975619 RepID=UPI00225AEA88|nr:MULTISPECIES: amidohydrolase family protein [unclassified Streptomyces]MCX5535825.1 amidohydrolase family protein [Streptomyces sp. NBC_00006]